MFKNIAKILSSHIIVKSLGLVNVGIVLIFISVTDFGDYSYLILLLHMVAVIIDPFLSSYLVDFKTFNYKKYNFGILFLSIILSPVFYFSIKQLRPELTLELFLLFSLTFILSTGLKSFLNVKERYLQYGLVDVCRQLSVFLSTIVFFYVLENRNYIQLLELNYLIAFITIIMLFLFLIKREEIQFDYSLPTLKKLIFESKFFILYVAIIPFISFIDSFFVEKHLSKDDLGLYSFSLKIYNVSLMLVVPIFTVLNIKQIEVAKEKNYYSFFKKNIKKTIFFATVLLGISIIANWIITAYLFTNYKESFIDTIILLFAAYISYISMPFSFLLAYRKYKWLLTLAVIAILINVFVNYFFIAKYGTIIAAISTFLAQTIINLGAAVLSYYLIDDEKEK